MIVQNEEGKSSPHRTVHESTPLLRDQNSKVRYDGTDHHHQTAEDAIESQLEDEPALLALSRTASYPLAGDVEPNLMTIRTNDSGNDRNSARGLESGGESGSGGSTDYASRFIDVSPTRFWTIFSGVLVGMVTRP